MPVKFKIINILHTLFLVFLLIALAGVILYALEGELLMEVACACVTHFDGQPHTGAGVVKIIEDYSLVPICLVSICVLLIINKVFAMTKVHLFFVNNKHFPFFMGIFLSTSALCYYLRLHAHFSI